MEHPALTPDLAPIQTLRDSTLSHGRAVLAEEQNMTDLSILRDPASPYYCDEEGYILDKLSFFQCHQCQNIYYGGRQDCGEAWEASNRPASEFVCAKCFGEASVSIRCARPEHRDFWVYKCRYCCSVAQWYCFGNTHFCTECHNRVGELEFRPPFSQECAGPRHCPLKVTHPPHGTEFILNCQLCLEEHERDPIIWERVKRLRYRKHLLRQAGRLASLLVIFLLFASPLYGFVAESGLRYHAVRTLFLLIRVLPLFLLGGSALAWYSYSRLWRATPYRPSWMTRLLVALAAVVYFQIFSTSALYDTLVLNVKMTWYILRVSLQLGASYHFILGSWIRLLQWSGAIVFVETSIVALYFPLNPLQTVAKDSVLLLLLSGTLFLLFAFLSGLKNQLMEVRFVHLLLERISSHFHWPDGF
jgi:hypothetical protein